MVCFHPLTGYRKRGGAITFRRLDAWSEIPVDVSCGQCLGCRLEYSRQWAVRGVHEASLHENNYFVTLTYSNDTIPDDGGLVKAHMQDFHKKLRREFVPTCPHPPKTPERDAWLKKHGIRMMYCGEYGDLTHRPHYHGIYFNLNLDDVKLHSTTKCGFRLYTSETLTRLWGKGHVVVAQATFETIAYVARYVTKKVNGKLAQVPDNSGLTHYERVHPDTGEIVEISPEFMETSRRPGIAAWWFARYKSDVFPRDEVVMNGRKMRPPKFYDMLAHKDVESGNMRESELNHIKHKRVVKLIKNSHNINADRKAAREAILRARFSKFKRDSV